MIKLLKRKIQLLTNFLERLRLKPIDTIKLTFYAILIKQFYKTFTWIVSFMIFGPSFFEENPVESIKTIFNWMWSNLTFTSSFILVKAQNLINDLIRYFTNWDIPNVENPKMNKNTHPLLTTEMEESKPVSSKSVRREDPETFSKYRKSWENRPTSTPTSNLDDSWWKNTNWTYVIIGTIVVGVLVGGTYYSWDSISTLVPSAANSIWQNVRIFKTFIWRSRDSSEGDGTGEHNNSTMTFRPEAGPEHEDITLADDRTNNKGKEVDRAILTRTMSQEELSEVNPTHQFQNNEVSTSGTSSETSTDSSSSSDSQITISNWRTKARKYFSFNELKDSNPEPNVEPENIAESLPFSFMCDIWVMLKPGVYPSPNQVFIINLN